MSAIYAIIPAAYAVDLNRAFEAMNYGPDVFEGRLSSNAGVVFGDPATHFHMYDASASPTAFATCAAAKSGTIPPNDINGNPVGWDAGGKISAAAAIAAFAQLELWANDSSRSPSQFADEQRNGLGLYLIPDPY